MKISASLEDCLTAVNLQRAIDALRTDKAPWSRRVDNARFRREPHRFVLELVEALRNGQYRPQPVREYQAKKADGKQRTIALYHLRDKLVQRCVLQGVSRESEAQFHPGSVGYRPGRSVQGALSIARDRVAAGQCWVVRADIRQFFDSIPQKRLAKKLRGTFRDERLSAISEQCFIPGEQGWLRLKRAAGIRHGAILSPLLCNIYLHELDMFWASRAVAFVRFADDFLLALASQKAARQALAATERKLKVMGLALNPDKTFVSRASKKVKFLGRPLVNSRPLANLVAADR